MGTQNLEISRFEVTGVFTHPNAHVDIVLVHGLNGEPKRTWTAKNGLYWPAELLPETLKDQPANVLVYGYNADVYSRSHDAGASDNFILQHAQTLVAHLTAYRRSEGTTSNPIVWIAHSLGGILVKRALLYSNDVRDTEHEAYRSICVSTYGIIFLGTPHTGSGLATWGRILQGMSDAILPKKLFESESILLKTLKRDNERLQEINNHFLDIYQRFRIQMVHESHKTDLKGIKALVVDADSAGPQLPGVMYYGIEATHSGMCKFDGPNAPGYRTMTSAIREWVDDAPQVIDVRWKVEKEERVARAQREMDERRMSYTALRTSVDTSSGANINEITSVLSLQSNTPTNAAHTVIPTTDGLVESPTTMRDVADAATSTMPLLPPPVSSGNSDASTAKPDPLFLHPEKFRPNSYFVGREKELKDLHQKLTDKSKRAEGTSAVVIHSLPGGGKTHLARQYVFQHRTDYPGGIYWVRAKSIPEMEQFYWKIAKNEALRDVVAKTLGDAPSASGVADNKELCNPQNIVDIVRSWFSSFDQWLLVFDGIIFNTPGIERFIPDAKNTSLIYTSIQGGVSGRYEFDNPQIMKLDMLSPEEARDLLLTEMERKKPWTHDDRTRALELVKLMGRLPLMVHIAAQHLKATREPLSKYMRTYRTRIRAGDLSAYSAVWDELKSRGEYPALNLMYILAYFDSRVPVGLLHLGLGALDSRTPVMTRDASHRTKSLNNSLRTLIAFALLERSESDTISPTSSQSSSKRSNDKAPEFVDLLRIHTVVQLFFVDVLADDKQSDFWLERSASVFCHAFDEAGRLIKNAPKVGLLDDYRCFKIHGEKLLEHLGRMEKKAALSLVLANARSHISSRLGVCEQAIVKLSEATQIYIVTEMDLDNPNQEDFSLVSVFERANSISDSEDSTTSSSQASAQNSGITTRTGTGFDGERAGVHIINTNPALNMDIDTPADLEAELALGDAIGDRSSGKGKAPMDQPWTNTQENNANGNAVFQSPDLIYSPMVPGGHNPYHWHVPYPTMQNTIPAPPTPDEPYETEDAMTEVPTPHIPVASPVETEIHHPNFQPGFGLRYSGSIASDHRTVRRINDRRYHDRAGAWRDKTISDPRISVSREFARGSVYMPHNESSDTRSPGRSRITAESEAELALNKLRASAAPSSPLRSRRESVSASNAVEDADDDGNSHKQNKSRAQSTGTLGVRPLLTLRHDPQVQGIPIKQNIDEEGAVSSSYGTSSSRPAKRISQSPPSSWKKTLKRFKESILPSRPGTSSSQNRAQQQRPENVPPNNSGGALLSADADNALASSIDSLLGSQPGPMFRGSRTSSSTPNQGYGPFSPPPHLPSSHHHYTPAPLLFQDGNAAGGGGMSSSLQRDFPASIQQWGTQVYHPGHQRISSSDLSFGFPDEDPMSASYPFVGQSTHPYPFSLQTQQVPNQSPPQALSPIQQTQQQLLRPARFADGYTSQPMSRNTSSQSQPVAVGHSRQSTRLMSGPAATGDVANFVEENPPHSHSLPQSVDGRPVPVSVLPPLLRRNSRSSLVETEPSPQTANPFADVTTSYRRWEERHVQGPYTHSWRVTEMHSTQPGVPGPSSFRPTLGTIGAGAVVHNSGSGSGSGSGGAGLDRTGGVVMSRSQSDSMTGSGSGSGSRHGSVAVPAAGTWTTRSNAVLPMEPPNIGINPYPAQLANVDGSGYSSEPMSRGGSGPGNGNGTAHVRGANGNASGPAGRVLQEFGSSIHGAR